MTKTLYQAIIEMKSPRRPLGLYDCIRFAKIRNDSGDPSYSRSNSTMKKTPRVRPI